MNTEFFKLAIVGEPLSHSISPTIQLAAMDSVNIKGSYEKFEISSKNLKKQINFFINNNYRGFNVTIPHKIEIMKYLDEIDEKALKIGAVNTVKIFDDGKLKGFNTDISGFLDSLKGQKYEKAMLLGCGGAANAVVFALEIAGCAEITICARNKNKAETFVNKISDKTKMKYNIKNIAEISSLNEIDIVVNATPLGTKGINENLTPLTSDVFKTVRNNLFVYDLVYNPSETLFLKNAKFMNLKYQNGFEMLILQGAKAFEIWTGIYPDVSLMKNAI